MRNTLIAMLFAAFVFLSGCANYYSCQYPEAYKKHRPATRKPEFRKDHGYQQNKYRSAARKAADQTDEALYLAILKLTIPLAFCKTNP